MVVVAMTMASCLVMAMINLVLFYGATGDGHCHMVMVIRMVVVVAVMMVAI